MECLYPDNPQLPKIYWADNQADQAGEYYTSPQEGKIAALPLTLCIPLECTQEFRDPDASLAKIDKLMSDLRPFVLYQLQAQLELQARYLLGEIRWTGGRELAGRTVPSQNRGELMKKIQFLSSTTTPRGEAFLIIQHALEAVWAAQEESEPLSADWKKRLPVCIKDMKVLPLEVATQKKAA